jgi:hypothetical protein
MTARLLTCLGAVSVTALGALAPGAYAKTRTVDCTGSDQRCTASFPLSGLKTGDRLVARLTDTDLQLRAVTPSSPSLQQFYGFSSFSMRLGGSEFVARIIITERPPRRGRVQFSFAVPPRMRDCGDFRFGLDGSRIRLDDLEARGVSCARARRVARGCVDGTGPGSGWGALEVDDTVILQRRAQRVTFDLVDVKSSCAPSG